MIVMRCKRKSRNNEDPGTDKRGKYERPQSNLSLCTVQLIKDHILSFPRLESHYCRQTRQYLDATLNVAKMFDLFTIIHPDTNVKLSRYRQVFKEYKLSFHRPKKDRCTTCTRFDFLSKKGKEIHQEQQQRHLENKNRSRECKAADKVKAEEDPSLKVFTFDLQAVLPTPSGEVSDFYYSRKFATYNLTIYDMALKDGYCYLWNEAEGKRGANEIATIIHNHLNSLSSSVRKVIFYSDCC